MSICLNTGTVLSQPVCPSSLEDAASTTQSSTTVINISPTISVETRPEPQTPAVKGIAKLVVTTHPSTTNSCNQVLQKVVNPPLITVLNSTGPLTVVKSLCVTSVVSSAPHYTLVNSAPINVTNTVGKAPTITVLNCGPLSSPVTVVKAITTQPVEKVSVDVPITSGIVNNPSPVPTILENRGHNVFVKNTCPDSTVPDNIPQSHKLLTANNFPHSNVLTNLNPPTKPTTVNGQRSKLKILSNVMMPGSSQSTGNILLNKPNTQQRYNVPRQQKLLSANGATTKYLNKPTPNNVIKTNTSLKPVQEKSPTRMVYPNQKNQIKNMPPNTYVQKSQHGIKTLSPQHKNIPGQVQRTGSGLRTIPPQRPQKLANKPNYIGKHAVQAQRMRQSHGKMKNLKMSQSAPYYHNPAIPEKQLTFNQALTAQIIETLSNTSIPSPNNRYEILPARYDNAFNCPDSKQVMETPKQQVDDKTKSGLDALSLICQAVLLDHNYNATLPSESPTRPSPPINTQAQVNGISSNSMYSPPISCKRRSLPSSNSISASSLSNVSLVPSQCNSLIGSHDDDAASDISDGSERKHDTEGEETDTAPEAEAVNNEDQFDHYGDYVTRCICEFLHDDGYMVECDRCKVWQHVQCVVKNRQVPDEYLCEMCDPTKPVEKQKARLLQQQWLRDRQLLDPKLRKDSKIKELVKHKEVVSDTESSDGEHIVHNNNVVAKGRVLINRRKSDGIQKPTRRESTKEPLQRRQKRKERKIVKRKTKTQVKQSHSDDENQDTWSSHLPQLRQWIEKYEEAVTNHYSPELRARISSIRVNGVHSDFNTQFDTTVCKCRVHTQPLTEIKYLVTTIQLVPNTPVIELRGKYMLSTQHRNSGGSLTTRQHSQRPGPFLFFYRLHKDNTEVCVDTRTYGNNARFIRRSCKPNAELRHCIEKGVLHLYVVSITTVEKNCELTIKHESHDLAAIGTTQIACACGNSEECAVNKTTIKKNGEVPEVHRKRRGRRTTSACLPSPEVTVKALVVKQEPVPVVPDPSEQKLPEKEETMEMEVKEPVEVKVEVEKEPLVVKEEVKIEIKEEKKEEKQEEDVEEKEEKPELQVEVKQEKIKEEAKSPNPTLVATRRSSQHKSDKEDNKEAPEPKEPKTKCKKLSREERKLEAILRAIEQMEKADQRKQEHQAKQAHRRESEPGPTPKEEEKQEPKMKRRRRRGRARTISTNTQNTRRSRLNSTDSYMTSGDENMLSPNESLPPNRTSFKEEQSENKAAGLLLALSSVDNASKSEKSPTHDGDSNSNSAHSSPETPLSSACLLVQAAVEPLEPGFKFPKTKKGLMNEWLNKVPEPVQSASSISPSSLMPHINTNSEETNSGFYTPSKNLAALAQAASFCDTTVQPRGSAKKRWLRQAISEDHSCDSSLSRPDSPPLSEMVAPPKKRRLPRESLSNDNSPPTTPTSTAPPVINKVDNAPPNQEGCVEIVYSSTDGDSPTQTTLESDAVLKERAAKMKQEFSKCIVPSNELPRSEIKPLNILLDPRLASRESHHHLFSNSEHLVGTVEKTLSIFGFENSGTEPMTPAKRKLSITEYRQRKKITTSDKAGERDLEPEPTSAEENNSSDSFKMSAAPRARSCSTSSSTSLTSSDDETLAAEVVVKAPAFNSEPTELERQREISSLRLKKAFGLAVDDETRKPPALDVEAILNCELEPKVKPIPLPSPTFPIPGSCEVLSRALTSPVPSPHPENSPAPLLPPDSPPPSPPPGNPVPAPICSSVPNCPSPMDTEENSAEKEVADEETEDKDGLKPNMFYTPDEEEEHAEPVLEDSERISYVPPFNNPVYPNSNFTTYSSTIDDDARYESRNPSPPPDMEMETSDFNTATS